MPDPRASRTGPDLAGVLAAAPLPTVLTTTDARVLVANRAMQRLVGVPADGLAGRFLAEFAGPPHGRLRRLATVAATAPHPVTAEVAFSLGRRRTVAVRVVVGRGGAPGREPFLVWQVTSAPTAHALPELAGHAPDAGPVAGPVAGPDVGPDAGPDAGCGRAGDSARTARSAQAAEAAPADPDRASSDPRELALLMIRTASDLPVGEVADRLARLAGQAFGGRPLRIALDGAGPVPVAAATDPVAALAAQVEAELGGTGPAALAAAGTPVVVADLATDGRFGDAARQIARRLGVASVLAVPLRRDVEVLGTLAVLDDAPGAFDDDAVALAEWLAGIAGGVLDAAVRCGSAATETEQLRTAMASRAVIEQAKGVLMGRHRVDADGAFAMLRTRSQAENRRLRDIAAALVADVSTGQGPGFGPPAPAAP